MSLYKFASISRYCASRTVLSTDRRLIVNNVRGFIRNRGGNEETPRSKQYLKALLNGVGVGLAVGIGHAVYTSYKSKDAHLVHERTEAFVLDELPNVKIIRKIVNTKDNHNLDLVLFQYQTCPFCCKVRAFLDGNQFSYSVVEVDAVLRQDIKWSPYKKVPMLLARTKDGKYIQLGDSSMIVSVLSSYLIDPSLDVSEYAKLYPSISYMNDEGKKIHDILNKYHLIYGEKIPKNKSKDDLDSERKWREWTDKHFIHLISPNVYRTKDEAFQTFEWFAKTSGWDEFFPRWERNLMVYVGATAMYLISKRLKKRHNLHEDVRQDIYAACNNWTAELNKRKSKFLGGDKPNLADLSLYGALTSMEGCQAFSDILTHTSIEPWFQAVKKHVTINRGEVFNLLQVQ
ncbi:prostaglandin E synthase 2 [Sitodiplosis mosellana]|uniref:prostaglandin E synthase 2 n=1 Tax=Sitodiplosis mosellana TaxID=263140 RepID=UPI002443D867|nr:prostaglandin E synthase 2 [Sitodiplosis mosellana]